MRDPLPEPGRNPRLLRGAILHFPDATPEGARVRRHHAEFLPDGVLRIENGRITDLAPAAAAASRGWQLDDAVDHRGRLLVPGFIDTHVHFPQLEIMGAWGEQLIGWLERHTFPMEQRFADPAYAAAQAEVFLDELLRRGTTTAAVYASSHRASAEALFAAASARHLRLIAGKVLMDRNAPAPLCDSAGSGVRDSRELIQRWHGRDRLGYAITPRFAPTSTPAQLLAAGELLAEYAEHEGVLLQTHLAENHDEIAWVRELFPDAQDYTDVYDRYGLLGPRSLLGHGIHLNDRELEVLAARRSVVVFCPSSNLFLGSGLLDLARLEGAGVRTALATDVGGGSSLSMLTAAADAYRVLQVQGQSLDPLAALYRITLGNARALGLDGQLGNFAPGREADLVVLDAGAPTLLARRAEHCETPADLLFAHMLLGDERSVAQTYILGEPVLPEAVATTAAAGA